MAGPARRNDETKRCDSVAAAACTTGVTRNDIAVPLPVIRRHGREPIYADMPKPKFAVVVPEHMINTS
ncbi:hypothetical protein I545_4467 [Mycobacterium kansasii 662]|uniref:Uncharacterized protein n=2 Tax=Mycobacterium kansasii TaxID=1768 RepID=A0A1V3WRM0_MYCKA|nr:hypothetical protein I545_4467 [Mycobacterium kansasii 662]OOK69603.1 hypothetical protein BZL29_6317 [Mycobacterium kansasii]